jgi:hypothetical protein
MTDKKDNESKEAPHPKNNEELKKILAEIEELGGPKKGTTKHGDWSIDSRAYDF